MLYASAGGFIRQTCIPEIVPPRASILQVLGVKPLTVIGCRNRWLKPKLGCNRFWARTGNRILGIRGADFR